MYENDKIENNEHQKKLIRIEIADASGHQTLMLSPEDTQELVEQQDQKWIFVDNMLVREGDLDKVNWSEADSVRVMPGLVGGAKLIRIEIADASGHQTLMLSPEDTQELVEQQDQKWIFVDNMLVREGDLNKVNWSEAESVRVMPGLVGGAEDYSKPKTLLEEILSKDKNQAFVSEEGKSWKGTRQERADAVLQCFEDSIESNKAAIGLLKSVIEENSDTVRIGKNYLIILGELASYCILLSDLLIPFHNVYSSRSHSGFRQIEVHPKDHWVRRHKTACIQVDSENTIPSLDTLTGLILGLVNDKITFSQDNMEPLRTALMETYGLVKSPISDVLFEYICSKFPITSYTENSVTVKGTNGWKWHLGFGDPEVGGFELLSSINGGTKRLIVEDTQVDDFWWGDFERTIEILHKWPREIANGTDCSVIYRSKGFAELCKTSPVFSNLAKKAAKGESALEEETESIWELLE